MAARALVLASALALVSAAPAPQKKAESVQETLHRQTQELMDAIAIGGASVWERYLDANVRYVDETGKVLTKKEMVEATKPLAQGVSGTIRVTEFEVADHGDVAVATHVDDETEDYHGHILHCQYRGTDTWLKTAQGWRVIEAQILPLRTDPPSLPLSPALRKEYSGRYSLTPEITYEIRESGDALEGQRAGRKAEPLRAEVADVLFVPGEPRYRKIIQRDSDGKITGFVERREAWDLLWKRVP
jgi:hypothetical protein